MCDFVYVDLAKLEKEERICRRLQHPNIGINIVRDANVISLNSSIARCYFRRSLTLFSV